MPTYRDMTFCANTQCNKKCHKYLTELKCKQSKIELLEELSEIELRRSMIEKKMQELTNVVCNTNCKAFALIFTLIIENINYVATGQVKLTEQEQDLIIREFVNNIKIKDNV